MHHKGNFVYIPGNHPETQILVPRDEFEQELKKRGSRAEAIKYFQEEHPAGKAELEYFRRWFETYRPKRE